MLEVEGLNKEIKVSIIVPVYNGRDTIEKCIKSIIKQKFQPFELIVIDDASIDGSYDVITQILNGSSITCKTVVHNKNFGIASTLNEGIKLSRSKYILIIHQDCELCNDNYLEKALNFMEQNSNIAVVCGVALYPITEFNFFEKVFLIESGHFSKTSCAGIEEISFAEHKCDLFSKDALLKVGGFDSEHFRASAEDQIASLRLRDLGYKIVRNSELKYFQRYGKSIATFKGLMKRVFKYGKTQVGVILLTHGNILARQNMTSDQKMRIKNRLTGTLCATLFICSAFALLLLYDLTLVFPLIAAPLIRIFHLAWRTHKCLPKINSGSLLVMSLLGFLADITYSLGLLYGIISSFTGKRL